MMEELTLDGGGFEARAISPFLEMGAYETLWKEPKASFKTSERFARSPGCVPSDFVPEGQAYKCARLVRERFAKLGSSDPEFECTVLGSTPASCGTQPIP